MGRKAKLKHLRKQQQTNPTADTQNSGEVEADPTHFVDELKHQGYDLKVSDRCPEIPEKIVNPQI
ncbi:MAG: hypothetical protein P5702_09635 [Limnospira sp. PMC 1291.21]|uniref:hypothetical protein n=1 Tax=Limnospira TaxID=2596745 RepID=UPI00061AF4CF|nr:MULTISPECIES: hypothetical protein [Limnospira]QJB26081.1 hypothetical protein HFV01_10140 [Limnospira fusiformis SAG 85.79]RAQ39062.1 hypothetical protein B9S53_23875 [Arthrospira sp. O9.13F]MDT9177805.1 hypothetical protein [Limnospira sp. PMC 1238.20]MDT9187914.1 hypothetical protein [Limnospira sp. PMC 894.15]MDT9193101.1 hypothetical protein [Limnospira sp. PMC 1245.20]